MEKSNKLHSLQELESDGFELEVIACIVGLLITG